ncbi:MAG: TonB-dependent receptor [Tannerella sp.]|jgi:TonB-linked SusC/RagA family outer membrane protein|nr:TonB-dependent receptor [Tannerella sp.]
MKHYKLLNIIFVASLMFLPRLVAAEEVSKVTLSNRITLRVALEEIEKQTNLSVDYEESKLDLNQHIEAAVSDMSVHDALTLILKNSGHTHTIRGSHVIISALKRQQADDRIQVTGTITDITGEPVPGVNIVERGTTNGNISDADGRFSLTVRSAASTLVFSYIGYLTQEIIVGTQRSLAIRMAEDAQLIDEVVVIGYGTQKRSEVTAAVASLGRESFNTTGAPSSVLELAKGRMAGVVITNPNGADPRADTEIQIRGISSITGGMSPLIVIDGVPGGDLALLQADDVESFDVLKDASAAAIYGTRGANGVVLITTKKAQRGEQKPTFDYSTYVSHDYVYRRPQVLTADEYRAYMNSGGYRSEVMVDYGSDTDWLGEMTNTGNVSHNHNLAMTGGSASMGYRASVFYRDISPIAIESGQSDWGGRLNINHLGLNNRLEVQIGLSANFRDRNRVGGNDSFEQAAQRNPTMPARDAEGNWIDDQGFGSYNPLARYDTREDYSTRTTLLGSARVSLTIIDGLKASVAASWQQYDDLRRQYYMRDSKESQDTYAGGGRAQKWQEQDYTRTIEPTIDFVRNFGGKHSFNAVAGYSYQYHANESFNAWNSKFATDAFLYNNLEAGAGRTEGTSFFGMGSGKSDDILIAFFGRVNYVLMNKYQFSATYRYEGSSRFGSDNRWGSFPALSAGWVLSEESFMKDIEAVNNLKIRAGFGVTGNQSIPNYRYMSTLQSNSIYPIDGGTWVSAYRPSRNPNPALKWEKKEELNVGVDFSLFNSRLNGTVDVYNRLTKDLLYTYNTQLPPYVLADIYTNVGEISNKGIEIGLSGTPVSGRDFTWDVNATFAYQKNTLESFSNQLYKATYKDDYQFTGVGYLGYAIRTQEGGALGEFYGHRYAGLDENGEWMFYNKNNEKVSYREITDDDKTWLGNGTPKYYISLGNTFRYRNFDLSLFFRGKLGFKILNTKELYFGNPAWLPNNVLKSATTKNSDLHVSMQYSDYYLEKGDFVKLDNVTLGYNFNIPNRTWVRSVRLYMAAQNLATFTGYSGTTPEVRDTGRPPSGSETGFASGIEERTFYPTTTTLMFGLNVGF